MMCHVRIICARVIVRHSLVGSAIRNIAIRELQACKSEKWDKGWRDKTQDTRGQGHAADDDAYDDAAAHLFSPF